MYELHYLDWRTRKHGTALVTGAASFEAARRIGESANPDWEIIGIRRLGA